MIRDDVADGVARLRRVGFVLAVGGAGIVVGVAALLAWLLAVDLHLGFEVVGSRVLECLTR